jgi:hypothetical protein
MGWLLGTARSQFHRAICRAAGRLCVSGFIRASRSIDRQPSEAGVKQRAPHKTTSLFSSSYTTWNLEHFGYCCFSIKSKYFVFFLRMLLVANQPEADIS